jgi:uncharacterized protein YjdB
VNVFPDSLTLQSVGDTSGFAAHALDRNGNIISGASISWSSLDPAIATVSTGKVTATGVGRARIVATSNLRADTGIVSVTQDVARPTRIVASPDSVILETLTPAGATGAQLNAVTYDQNGNVIPGAWVTWQSLDPAIATVTEHGGVVAVSNGVARMTASNLVVGISDTVLAIVRQRASYIALSPDTAVIGIGGTTSIVPTLRDSLGYAINEPRAVTWTSLDPSIATVSGTSTGLVTGANLGSARVVGTLETGRADTVWIVVTAGVASSQSVRRSSSTNHLSAGPSPDPSTKTVATLRSVLDDPRRRAVLRASRR